MTADPPEYDEIWDSLFHGAAWRAYLELLAEQGYPPDSEAHRRRTYDYYEQALREKNAAKEPG